MQTAFLGDLLLCIPLLKKVKELWPEQKLGLVCRKGFGDFFLKTHLVDEVFEIQKGKKETYEKALAGIAQFEVQHLISPHESLRTAFFCRSIEAKHKVSYKKFWSFLVYNQTEVRDYRLPDAMRQLSLLRSFNAQLESQIQDYASTAKPFHPDAQRKLSAPPAWASMSLRKAVLADSTLFYSLKEKYQLDEYDKGPVVLIFPGSVWATKRWTEEGFVETAKTLKAQGYQIIVMGGPGEEVLAERVAAQIPGTRSLAGKTKVFESAQLIAHAALLIGNDSASTHLAAVCETPLIAVFGPTILEFGFRPWSSESHVVEIAGLPCRPCGKHGHNKCPIGTHECMKGIAAAEVVKTARAILPNSPSH
ncbi:Lipopolysaccharide core heptosyltransferase RfaQ [compost metagenome]